MGLCNILEMWGDRGKPKRLDCGTLQCHNEMIVAWLVGGHTISSRPCAKWWSHFSYVRKTWLDCYARIQNESSVMGYLVTSHKALDTMVASMDTVLICTCVQRICLCGPLGAPRTYKRPIERCYCICRKGAYAACLCDYIFDGEPSLMLLLLCYSPFAATRIKFFANCCFPFFTALPSLFRHKGMDP